jgi:hypothetical protein
MSTPDKTEYPDPTKFHAALAEMRRRADEKARPLFRQMQAEWAAEDEAAAESEDDE